MSRDLRGQLSEVGPPAEGVVGDLPVAGNNRRPWMLATLIVVVGGGYAIYAGRNASPDPARLGMKASIDQPAAVVTPTVATPAPQAMNQPATPPIQAASGSTPIASDIADMSSVGQTGMPITSAETKVAVKVRTVRPVGVFAHSVAKATPPTADIDEIGITEE